MRVLRWLDRHFEETCMMVALALICSVMGVSVVMRYLFNDSLSWAEEVSRYLFVWSAFLSASLCIRRRSSIKIDMLLTALPRYVQWVNIVFVDLLMFLFFAYMFKGAINVAIATYESQQSSPALMLPMYWVYSAAAAGSFLSMIRLTQRLFCMLKKPGSGYEVHLKAGRGE